MIGTVFAIIGLAVVASVVLALAYWACVVIVDLIAWLIGE